MEEYYFLFFLAFLYVIFGTVQDLKNREVSNWLNFSLVVFAFAYRIFYASAFDNWEFLWFGFLGFLIFFALAHSFYYGGVFAGGDAKLFMGFGLILPFENYPDLIFLSLFFIFILFSAGAIYTLIYSFFLVYKERKKFIKDFKKKFLAYKYLFLFSLAFSIMSLFLVNNYVFKLFITIFSFFVPALYIYLKAFEKTCMIRFVSPNELTEGDWLNKDVRIGNKMIKKSVHGLNTEEIRMLLKARKKVWIKYGVPFVPAFLIALLTMVFFSLALKVDLKSFLISLF